MTQKARILALFRRKKRWSNYELRSMPHLVGFQYPVRIKELKEKGYDIRGERDLIDTQKYWYVFTDSKKDKND